MQKSPLRSHVNISNLVSWSHCIASSMSLAFEKFTSYLSTLTEDCGGESVKWNLKCNDLVTCVNLVAKKLRDNEQKWNILTRFWVENLAYVATLCQGNNHAQQLRKQQIVSTYHQLVTTNLS